MSYNIHHGVGLDEVLDLKRIAQIIKETQANIIGLQEVDRFYGARSEFKDQAKELATLLNCDYHYAPNVKKSAEHPDDESHEYGIATFSRYPILSTKHILLESFGQEQRGVLKVTIDVEGETVSVYNTHLCLDSDNRYAQMTELIDMISDDPYPSILLGDFNAQPESDAITLLREQTDLIDTFEHISPAFTIPSNQPNRRIDYIFTSSSIKSENQTVIQTEASDHLPILTRSHIIK